MAEILFLPACFALLKWYEFKKVCKFYDLFQVRCNRFWLDDLAQTLTNPNVLQTMLIIIGISFMSLVLVLYADYLTEKENYHLTKMDEARSRRNNIKRRH
jgi:hypothetical protein